MSGRTISKCSVLNDGWRLRTDCSESVRRYLGKLRVFESVVMLEFVCQVEDE